jgi:hypothetical protein
MKRVVLLGAGASKSYDASKTKERMPIANDFFKTFNKLSISENQWVIIGSIIEYVRKFRKIDIEDFHNFNEDIEDLHSEIQEKLYEILIKNRESFLGGKGTPREEFMDNFTVYKTYFELVFLFVSAINEIQNGKVSETHLNLAKQLTKEDSIITFNWDTLLDRALDESSDWNPDNGYLIKPQYIYRDKWDVPNVESTINYPLLLKLHGSSNWLTSHPVPEDGELVPTQEQSIEDFCVYVSNEKPYSCFKGRYSEGYEDYSYGYYPVNLPFEGKSAPEGKVFIRGSIKNPFMQEPTSDDKGLNSIPLIIPPVKKKEYDNFGNLFSTLWEKAEQELIEASEIYIIGYSFPKTDYRSSELFKNAFLKRTDMPNIVIINPNPELIEERFKYDFGITEDKLTVIKDYFTKETKITVANNL